MNLNNVWILYRSDSYIAENESAKCKERLEKLGIQVISLILGIDINELPELIKNLESQMKKAAQELNFEEAATLRDRIKKIRQKLSGS